MKSLQKIINVLDVYFCSVIIIQDKKVYSIIWGKNCIKCQIHQKVLGFSHQVYEAQKHEARDWLWNMGDKSLYSWNGIEYNLMILHT